MVRATDIGTIAAQDVVVVLVGLTAGWRKRRSARQYFRAAFGDQAFVPWIPYPLGLRASAAWVSFLLRRRFAPDGAGRLHFVFYIGGGVIFRLLHAQGARWPIGRTVWDRGPLQEQLARRLCARVPAFLLTLLGFRSVVDLSRTDPASLSFPSSPLGAGLIVETKSSALARWLGIEEATLDLSPEALERLLPDADAIVTVPLSHDDVYDDAHFLDQASTFLKTRAFAGPGQEVAR
ncbi:hypothetical protein [Aestuariicoccus sp. MJ-SS9]|uniref:hypothetical protein n=1 Tax=Aestuariicoccus sp. MJ-SS9 TaxID=3079855 RepID=UPI002910708E|nr:hypothetical protein [Aestuariicoccus sp. MJ-SS9]MDU8911432.1 hypothetical protein [Aestuariicoccus sp. MJ-SS9]